MLQEIFTNNGWNGSSSNEDQWIVHLEWHPVTIDQCSLVLAMTTSLQDHPSRVSKQDGEMGVCKIAKKYSKCKNEPAQSGW